MHRSLAGALALALAAVPVTAWSQSADSSVADLPLIEDATARPGRVLAIFLTGDGGWATLDRSVARVLTDSGIAVVGFDSRRYLSPRRTADQSARDVARVARYYLARWHRDRLMLVGYSRGADMLPFVATRLPADLRSRLTGVAMLGVDTEASFEFHLIDLIRDVHRKGDPPILPEIERLRGTPMVCVYGAGEEHSACRDADPSLITRFERKGDHHFDHDYPAIALLILSSLPH
jgi:type IV secretory pathway VirJ component